MSFYKIRPRAGTKAQWERANTVLGEREIGFEIPDSGVGSGQVRMKMGDGSTPWKNLKYAIVTSTDTVLPWSKWISCGVNDCGITLKYRFNDTLKLVELNWDGRVTNMIGGNTMGYMWEGFPSDKSPNTNVFIPAMYPGGVLAIRFYPKTSDITANHWTITSLKENVSDAYVCGTFIYSYA